MIVVPYNTAPQGEVRMKFWVEYFTCDEFCDGGPSYSEEVEAENRDEVRDKLLAKHLGLDVIIDSIEPR